MNTKKESYQISSSHPLDYRKDGSVNFISKNKQIGESDFRLHFVLPNVKLGKREKIEDLLNQIRSRISKVGTPQTVQVLERRKNFLDIAVGMRFDYQAIGYLHYQNKKILLMDSGSTYFEVAPLVCRAFYGYMEHIGKPSKYKMCTKQSLHHERKLGEQKYREKMQRNAKRKNSRERSNRSFSSEKSPISSEGRNRSRFSSPNRHSPSLEPRRMVVPEIPRPPFQNRVIVAGIPQAMEYQQIDDELYDQGYSVDKMLWIRKNDIDLLQIKLAGNANYERLESQGVRLKGQSTALVLVNEYDTDQTIIQKLMDHQARVQFKSYMQKSSVIEYLSKYGSVVDCIEDRDNQKVYYVTFSKKQAALTIIAARDPGFQSFLDKDIFPIRRRAEGFARQRRESGRQILRQSRGPVIDRDRERERDWERERERERENGKYDRPPQRYY